MTVRKTRRAGQPLAVVLILILAWTGGRALLWQTPWPGDTLVDVYRLTVRDELNNRGYVVATRARTRSIPSRRMAPAVSPHFEQRNLRVNAPLLPLNYLTALPRSKVILEEKGGAGSSNLPSNWHTPDTISAVGSHPDHVVAARGSTRQIPGRQKEARRWSGDAWLLLRDGAVRTPVSPAGLLPASYGASQAGAVLRFALAPNVEARPTAHLRVNKALIEDGESEIALGANLRPIPALPVTAHAEMRFTQISGEMLVRPAAFVTTGVDAMPVPLGARLRGYAQAGYVGGRDATAFADGQVVVDRRVFTSGTGGLDLGAGVWGGAQRGAERLDIGPSASIAGQVGPIPLRLSMDYRLRVAGQAAPDSGAVLTLSTGF